MGIEWTKIVQIDQIFHKQRWNNKKEKQNENDGEKSHYDPN